MKTGDYVLALENTEILTKGNIYYINRTKDSSIELYGLISHTGVYTSDILSIIRKIRNINTIEPKELFESSSVYNIIAFKEHVIHQCTKVKISIVDIVFFTGFATQIKRRGDMLSYPYKVYNINVAMVDIESIPKGNKSKNVPANRLFAIKNIPHVYKKFFLAPVGTDNELPSEYIEAQTQGTKKMSMTKELAENTYKFIEVQTQGNKKMSMTKELVNENTNAASVAARITAGRTANAVVLGKVSTMVPEDMQEYIDTPLGAVVLANLMLVSLKTFNVDNEKAEWVVQAMLDSAMLDVMAEFKLDELMKELINSVT